MGRLNRDESEKDSQRELTKLVREEMKSMGIENTEGISDLELLYMMSDTLVDMSNFKSKATTGRPMVARSGRELVLHRVRERLLKKAEGISEKKAKGGFFSRIKVGDDEKEIRGMLSRVESEIDEFKDKRIRDDEEIEEEIAKLMWDEKADGR